MRRHLSILLGGGVACLFAFTLAVSAAGAAERQAIPATEPFEGYVLADGLDFPWEILWGPDGNLWVTERTGLRITKVNPETGAKKTIGSIPEAYPGPQHEGILGMAFAPGFLKDVDDDFLYVYYTCKDKSSEKRWGRLAKFAYDKDKDALGEKTILLDRLPAGDDHNAGRVRFGPDGKIYLTIGEQGHNQGANYCLPIEAQRIPTEGELAKNDWDAYRGKSLRINPDGSIPEDNPRIKGILSHIYTYGHRNPQGLYFIGNDLYSSEHGPSSDDELNRLEAGGNYGWPHVAGFRDGQAYVYANYSAASNCSSLPFDPNVIPKGVPIQEEIEWYAGDFKPPVKTFYTVREDHDYSDSRCGADNAYLCWPTVAPSDIVYYPGDGAIPGWRKSILMTTLKTGTLFVIRMSGDEKQVQGDYSTHFHSRNRLRAVAIDPEGRNVYIATDNSGGAMDEAGKPAGSVENPGSILVYRYAR